MSARHIFLVVYALYKWFVADLPVTHDIVGSGLLSFLYAHCYLRMQHQEKSMLLTQV